MIEGLSFYLVLVLISVCFVVGVLVGRVFGFEDGKASMKQYLEKINRVRVLVRRNGKESVVLDTCPRVMKYYAEYENKENYEFQFTNDVFLSVSFNGDEL